MSKNQVRYRHILTSIPRYDRSLAFLSSANPGEVKRALFFVHGFDGKATTTWADFLSLADDSQTSDWWQYADLFFYDYHRASIHEQIHDNAFDLLRFLKEMFPSPPAALFNRPEENLALRAGDFRYDELFLVGHSEGGLLTRHAILEEAKNDPSLASYSGGPIPQPQGLLTAELRLFSPAIAGTIYTGILGLIARTSVVKMTMAASPAEAGLAAGSPPVTTARRQTESLATKFGMRCFSAHILWAKRDDIVHKTAYWLDRVCKSSPAGTKHDTICKPNTTYRLPLEFVEKGVEICA